MIFNFKRVKTKLEDGVDGLKFDANRVIASAPEDVLEVFHQNGIDLTESCPGRFLKVFCLNKQELKEVSENLARYKELGLIDIIKGNVNNLQVRVFKNSFMSRLISRIQAGEPYLNQDGSLADSVLNNKPTQIPANVTQNDLVNAQIEYEANKELETPEDVMANMSPEDKIVYNEIAEKLNYLVLANPLDSMLVKVVNNAMSKVVSAIFREEYKYIGLGEMVESTMFDELEISQEDQERIKEIVSGAFQNEERKVA